LTVELLVVLRVDWKAALMVVMMVVMMVEMKVES
jgi:hypothetical protein